MTTGELTGHECQIQMFVVFWGDPWVFVYFYKQTHWNSPKKCLGSKNGSVTETVELPDGLVGNDVTKTTKNRKGRKQVLDPEKVGDFGDYLW